MRPVCLASEANNSQLSQVLAGIVDAITKFADKDGVLCTSTEDMVASLEAVNSDPDARNISLFSTDVSGMYPALDIEVIAKWLAEEYLQSDLEILNLDPLELALYLAVTNNQTELDNLGLMEVVHTRMASSGARPGVTTKEVLDRDEKTVSLFNPPLRAPTQIETKKMFAVALESLVLASMNNHIYSFAGDFRKQSKGGAIGNVLTGSLGAFAMVIWSRGFMKNLNYAMTEVENFKHYLLKIYVDDGNQICSTNPSRSSVGPGGQRDQQHGVVQHVQGEGHQPPITSRTGSCQVHQGLSMTPPTRQGGPGGQQDQGLGVVLHDLGEGYQPPITSRCGRSQVPQGLSTAPLPTQVDRWTRWTARSRTWGSSS